jgi:hypothetical protein
VNCGQRLNKLPNLRPRGGFIHQLLIQAAQQDQHQLATWHANVVLTCKFNNLTQDSIVLERAPASFEELDFAYREREVACWCVLGALRELVRRSFDQR